MINYLSQINLGGITMISAIEIDSVVVSLTNDETGEHIVGEDECSLYLAKREELFNKKVEQMKLEHDNFMLNREKDIEEAYPGYVKCPKPKPRWTCPAEQKKFEQEVIRPIPVPQKNKAVQNAERFPILNNIVNRGVPQPPMVEQPQGAKLHVNPQIDKLAKEIRSATIGDDADMSDPKMRYYEQQALLTAISGVEDFLKGVVKEVEGLGSRLTTDEYGDTVIDFTDQVEFGPDGKIVHNEDKPKVQEPKHIPQQLLDAGYNPATGLLDPNVAYQNSLAKTNGRNFVSNGRYSTIYPNDIPNPVNQGGIDLGGPNRPRRTNGSMMGNMVFQGNPPSPIQQQLQNMACSKYTMQLQPQQYQYQTCYPPQQNLNFGWIQFGNLGFNPYHDTLNLNLNMFGGNIQAYTDEFNRREELAKTYIEREIATLSVKKKFNAMICPELNHDEFVAMLRKEYTYVNPQERKRLADEELKRQQEIDVNVFNDSLVFNSLGIRFVKSMRTMMLVDGVWYENYEGDKLVTHNGLVYYMDTVADEMARQRVYVQEKQNEYYRWIQEQQAKTLMYLSRHRAGHIIGPAFYGDYSKMSKNEMLNMYCSLEVQSLDPEGDRRRARELWYGMNYKRSYDMYETSLRSGVSFTPSFNTLGTMYMCQDPSFRRDLIVKKLTKTPNELLVDEDLHRGFVNDHKLSKELFMKTLEERGCSADRSHKCKKYVDPISGEVLRPLYYTKSLSDSIDFDNPHSMLDEEGNVIPAQEDEIQLTIIGGAAIPRHLMHNPPAETLSQEDRAISRELSIADLRASDSIDILRDIKKKMDEEESKRIEANKSKSIENKPVEENKSEVINPDKDVVLEETTVENKPEAINPDKDVVLEETTVENKPVEETKTEVINQDKDVVSEETTVENKPVEENKSEVINPDKDVVLEETTVENKPEIRVVALSQKIVREPEVVKCYKNRPKQQFTVLPGGRRVDHIYDLSTEKYLDFLESATLINNCFYPDLKDPIHGEFREVDTFSTSTKSYEEVLNEEFGNKIETLEEIDARRVIKYTKKEKLGVYRNVSASVTPHMHAYLGYVEYRLAHCLEQRQIEEFDTTLDYTETEKLTLECVKMLREIYPDISTFTISDRVFKMAFYPSMAFMNDGDQILSNRICKLYEMMIIAKDYINKYRRMNISYRSLTHIDKLLLSKAYWDFRYLRKLVPLLQIMESSEEYYDEDTADNLKFHPIYSDIEMFKLIDMMIYRNSLEEYLTKLKISREEPSNE